MSSGLTVAEENAISALGSIWDSLCREIVGRGESRDSDLAEMVVHIHALQRSIMAQAAAREYPFRYRLLGEVLER